MWAGAGHEFLLLCSQALRFYGKDFTVEMLLVIAYKKKELGIFFLLYCCYPDPHEVFQQSVIAFLQGS